MKIIFYVCLRLWFPHEKPTRARSFLFVLSAEYSVAMDMTCLEPQWPGCGFVMLIYRPMLPDWAQIFVTYQSCWLLDLVSLSCAVRGYIGLKGWLYTSEMDMMHFDKPNLNLVVEKCCLFRFVFWERICLCFVLTATAQPWMDDQIFDCLLTSIAAYTSKGCGCLSIVCVWFEKPASATVVFYDHESWWCYSLWLHDCVLVRSVGCRPDPCVW